MPADIYANNWSEADASNTTAAPDGAPEGMAPGGVNNWARATMGALKRYVNQQSPVTTAGSGTAYTVSYSVAPGALVTGMTHLLLFHAANGAAATLNVNALGAAPLHYFAAGAWRVAPTGLIGADQVCRVSYNTAAGAYRILRPRDDTGEVVMFAGATVPAGTLLCYGQAVSRTDYVGLFAALSTTHGVGDGSSTFNLPDLRGRVGAGKSDMGGSDAGTLTGGTVLGAGLGAQSGTGNASVNGSTGASNNNTGTNNGATGDFATALHGHTISLDAPVTVTSIVQPTRVLNYIIRI